MNIYEENGHKNRDDYLQSVADNYGVNIYDVKNLAYMLGASEDFDGLICALGEYM